MDSKYLSKSTIESFNKISKVTDRTELIHELKELFNKPYTLQSMWKFKPYFEILTDDEVKEDQLLIAAFYLISIISGDLKRSEYYYHLFDERYKPFINFLKPTMSFKEYKENVNYLIDNKLGPVRNLTLTAGRPSASNGIYDYTPYLKELIEDEDNTKLMLETIFGNKSYLVYEVMKIEYLYQTNNCYEALVNTVAIIPLLSKPEHVRILFAALYIEGEIMIVNGYVKSTKSVIKSMYDRLHSAGLEELIPNVLALDAWAALYEMDIARVNRWMEEDAPNELKAFSMLDLFQYMIKMKIYLVQEKYHSITALAMRLKPLLEAGHRYKDLCELNVIWAISEFNRENFEDAFIHLEKALDLSSKYRYDRTLANTGDLLYKLLLEYIKQKGSNDYLGYIIGITKETAERFPRYLKKITNLDEELSKTEMIVLDLLNQGKSNNEIAEYLEITLNTVKFHNKNIFRKLNVKSRKAAVQAAYNLGILH